MKKTALLLLCLLALLLGGCATDVDLGVIGGADGPTAIFITGPGGAAPTE